MNTELENSIDTEVNWAEQINNTKKAIAEYNKTIDFLQSTTYFKNYNILDWTDKLDLSKDFNIQPISFQNKYVLFNYEDDEKVFPCRPLNLSRAFHEPCNYGYAHYALQRRLPNYLQRQALPWFPLP